MEAKIRLYCHMKDITFTYTSFAYNIFGSNPASNIALVPADYGTLGSTPLATAIAYDNLNVPDWNEWPLNGVGRSAIVGGDITKLGIRESNYDGPNSEPPWQSNKHVIVRFNSADTKGVTRAPQLVVTFATPKRWKGNILIDQLYFQHVERMRR